MLPISLKENIALKMGALKDVQHLTAGKVNISALALAYSLKCKNGLAPKIVGNLPCNKFYTYRYIKKAMLTPFEFNNADAGNHVKSEYSIRLGNRF